MTPRSSIFITYIHYLFLSIWKHYNYLSIIHKITFCSFLFLSIYNLYSIYSLSSFHCTCIFLHMYTDMHTPYHGSSFYPWLTIAPSLAPTNNTPISTFFPLHSTIKLPSVNFCILLLFSILFTPFSLSYSLSTSLWNSLINPVSYSFFSFFNSLFFL